MAFNQSIEERQAQDAVQPLLLRPEEFSQMTIQSVKRKETLFTQTMLALRQAAFAPDHTKVFNRRWRIGQVAKMVGRSTQSIRRKQAEGKIPTPDKSDKGRGGLYSLEDINRIRDVFGTRPGRAPTDEPAVLALSSFKGGCGKSTISVHCAQYLAIKGYRVLFIDVDPQGSGSTLFGVNPDLPDISSLAQKLSGDGMEQDSVPLRYTLEEYIAEDYSDFSKCIRPSYFPGVDLVPSDMSLNNAEYYLAAEVPEGDYLLNRLRDGIHSVWQDYDVVIIDPPPALGMLALSVLNAANALCIPMRPAVVDFASTAKFMSMLSDNLQIMVEKGYPLFYHFEAIVINGMNDSKSAHVEIVDAMRTMFSTEQLLDATMKDSAEIDSAGKEMMTVYDLVEPMTGHQTHKRCVSYLDKLNFEIETRIRKIWPSHKTALREEAQI